MTILQELAHLYTVRAKENEWPIPGFSTENISGAVALREDGSVEELISLKAPDDNKNPRPRRMAVPKATKRTSGIKTNIFWDKTAYVFGVTATDDGLGQGRRTEAEHLAFKAEHLKLLANASDPFLVAFRRFCETWNPSQFEDFLEAENLVDENFVFSMNGGRPFLHELPAAQALLATADEGKTMCLVSGEQGSVARLHPSIKGVMGAQSTGAALVSFNDLAYESHGKKQGDNAPVSESAAFAYGAALNGLLEKGSRNNLRIGGDTVVFWADQVKAEEVAGIAMMGADDSAIESELSDRLRALAKGKQRPDSDLDPETRLFVLGLAPNSARLAVRYWHPGTLGAMASAVTRFWDDMAMEPSPFVKDGVPLPPKPWALLYDVAPERKADNIPATLGGDLMRSILTNTRYPATWLATLVGRLRVEGEPERGRHGNVDGRRAAAIAAILRRNYQQEVPMALNEEARDSAYLLGRLFGAYYYAEKSNQERGAGLRQKYLGAASATPARVFPVLMRGYEHNLSSLLKAGGFKTGSGVKADRVVTNVLDALEGEMPATLTLEAQGRFFIGFYQQFSAFFEKTAEAADALSASPENNSQEENP